jgi:hypothetical protein
MNGSVSETESALGVHTMTQSALRASGTGLIIGPVLFGAGSALWEDDGAASVSKAIIFLGSLVTMLALPGLFARDPEGLGWAGLTGTVLLEAGLSIALLVGGAPLLFSGSLTTRESVTAFLLGISAIVGFALVAVSVLRSPVYPRGAGILMALTTFLFFFGFMVTEYLPAAVGVVNQAVLGLTLAGAFAWLGSVLWHSPSTAH